MAASVCSGTVTQSSNGEVLLFRDTGIYNAPVTSRVLNVYDNDGNLVQTISMGGTLTTSVNITTDVYYSFVLTVIDSTGTFTCTVNFLSTAFFEIAFAPAIAAQDCPCDDVFAVFYNLNRANLFKEAAEIYAQRGVAQNAQANIDEANFYVNTPYYAT